MYLSTYTVKVEHLEGVDQIQSLEWYDGDGKRGAPGDLPSRVSFYRSGNIRRMIWDDNDQIHRGNDLPASIGFKDSAALEILDASWHQHDEEHREGDMPSSIFIDPDDGRVCGLGFKKRGIGRDEEGLPGYVWINSDGSMENEDGEPMDCDLSRFQGDLPRPPPARRPPFIAPG